MMQKAQNLKHAQQKVGNESADDGEKRLDSIKSNMHLKNETFGNAGGRDLMQLIAYSIPTKFLKTSNLWLMIPIR